MTVDRTDTNSNFLDYDALLAVASELGWIEGELKREHNRYGDRLSVLTQKLLLHIDELNTQLDQMEQAEIAAALERTAEQEGRPS